MPEHHEGIVTPEIAKAAQFMTSSHGMLQSGVPPLVVIDSGILKGFVSVCPRWKGIDRKTFLSACHSVYTDEELKKLEREIRIWTGEEESRVLSMSMTGYEVPRGVMFLTRAMPSITITKNQVRFSKACHTKLGNCEWVEMFYHPVMQAVIIRESSPENMNAFRWVTESGKLIHSMETISFSQAVYETLHWIEDYQFRFRGITKVRNGATVIIFSLDEPQILVGSRKQSEDGSPSRYIPYTTDEKADDGNYTAYPQEWRRRQGMNSLLRRKRDEIVSSITEADIRCNGIIRENPLIGSIPGREEILKELDELLLSM